MRKWLSRHFRKRPNVDASVAPPPLITKIDYGDLWDKAYESLGKKNKSLVEDYETLLNCYRAEASIKNSLPPVGSRDRESELAMFVKIKSEEVKNTRLKVKLGEKEIVVQEQVTNIVKGIIYAKDFIGTAAASEPHAALAWAGVCLLLPLLTNSTEQAAAALEGLNHISDLIERYRVYELKFLNHSVVISDDTGIGFVEKLRGALARKTICLYTDILEYQIRAAIQYSRSTFLRGLRNLVVLDGWKSKLKDIDTSDAIIKEQLQTLNYAKIEDGFKEQGKKLYEIVQKLETKDPDTDEVDCIRVFSGVDYTLIKDRIPDRYQGTCQWFLTNDQFCWWKKFRGNANGDNSSRAAAKSGSKYAGQSVETAGEFQLLLVTANPGCGKSVLMKSVIDNEIAPTMQRITTYFFFKELQFGVTEALCALLHQIFIQQPDLLKLATDAYHSLGVNLSKNFDALWKLLVACGTEFSGEVICVLDALDECHPGSNTTASSSDLVQKLNDYYLRATAEQRTLKFLISARPSPLFEGLTKGLAPSTHLAADNSQILLQIELDVNSLRDARVQKLGLKDDVKDWLAKKLKPLTAHEYTYLWVTLIFTELEKKKLRGVGKRRLTKFLEEIPNSVNDAYERMLSGISSSDRRLVTSLFGILLAAERPLTLPELSVAWTISQPMETFDSYDALELQSPNDFEGTIKDLCGPFLIIINQTVYFIHWTAKAFLQSQESPPSDEPNQVPAAVPPPGITQNTWMHSFSIRDADLKLAEICLSFLNSEMFRSHPLEIYSRDSNAVVQDLGQAIDTYISKNDFFGYAAVYWPFHVFKHPDCFNHRPESFSPGDIGDVDGPLFRSWFLCFWRIAGQDLTVREAFNEMISLYVLGTGYTCAVDDHVHRIMDDKWAPDRLDQLKEKKNPTWL